MRGTLQTTTTTSGPYKPLGEMRMEEPPAPKPKLAAPKRKAAEKKTIKVDSDDDDDDDIEVVTKPVPKKTFKPSAVTCNSDDEVAIVPSKSKGKAKEVPKPLTDGDDTLKPSAATKGNGTAASERKRSACLDCRAKIIDADNDTQSSAKKGEQKGKEGVGKNEVDVKEQEGKGEAKPKEEQDKDKTEHGRPITIPPKKSTHGKAIASTSRASSLTPSTILRTTKPPSPKPMPSAKSIASNKSAAAPTPSSSTATSSSAATAKPGSKRTSGSESGAHTPTPRAPDLILPT
ncbi:hypothetical protein DXG01_010960 [Tephrocybe rancida]|nr:hypothetical protein DXG01_010960 [Tephrocybe rancida]